MCKSKHACNGPGILAEDVLDLFDPLHACFDLSIIVSTHNNGHGSIIINALFIVSLI